MLQSSTGGIAMKGYVQNIESIAVNNDEFRQVFYTANHCQIVFMAAKPKKEIGNEYQAWRSQSPSKKAR
jgi:hypothetical protein